MLLKGDQLRQHLERGVRSLYVVYGDSPLLVLEAADVLRQAAKKAGFSEREVLTALSGFNWQQLHEAGGSLSLFGERKLLDLRIPNGKPGKEGSAALQAWCGQEHPDTILLITLPELDWKEEKAAWFTLLVERGIVVKCQEPPQAELPGWIAGRLRRQKQRADDDTLRFMAEKVEGNLLAAHQEIQKLGLLYPEGTLSLAQVKAAVLNVARYSIDDLREALLMADARRVLRTLDGLLQEGEAPTLILWAICEELRALAVLSMGMARGQKFDVLCKEAKVWGPRQALLKRALPRFSPTLLQHALHHAATTDALIKGARSGNIPESLTQLCLLLLPQQAKKPR